MKTGYEFFEHTADVGLRATGRTLDELFANAARGLVELLAEDSRIEPGETRTVELSAPSVEALLCTWLTELLVWFGQDHFLPCGYAFDTLTQTNLRASVQGERFNSSRHVYGTEVKGVTRHQLQVTHQDDHWEAQVIFDV